jgi:rare lipoprotein A
MFMRANLQIGGLMIAASLLGASPMAAQGAKMHKGHNAKTHSLAGARAPRPLGMASWYGERHQGRKMANGQKFDRRELTAASWTLALGTTIRVVNLRNGKSVVVTVTDRGPARRLHRVLDLSEAAALQLDYLGQGLAPIFYSQAAFFEPEGAPVSGSLIEPSSSNLLVAGGSAEPIM